MTVAQHCKYTQTIELYTLNEGAYLSEAIKSIVMNSETRVRSAYKGKSLVMYLRDNIIYAASSLPVW